MKDTPVATQVHKLTQVAQTMAVSIKTQQFASNGTMTPTNNTVIPEESPLPTQLVLFTQIAETMEAADKTPRTNTLLSPTPGKEVTSPSSTPNLDPMDYEWTESGVIIRGVPDRFAVCYKFQHENVPVILHRWYPKSELDLPAVFAGADGNDDAQGLILTFDSDAGNCPGEDWGWIFTPFKEGRMEILSEDDQKLKLRAVNSGRIIYFDLTTNQFITP